MDLSTNYYDEIVELLLKENEEVFNNAKAGQCLKLEGLPLRQNEILCKKIRKKFPNISTNIISDQKSEFEITSTKLIELRNSSQSPILALIPS